MTEEPIPIDGSEGEPLVTRRIVVWRRLEPGDVRTPGTEIAPESPHLEVKILEVGIAASLHDRLRELWTKRDEATAVASGWSARYEPAGVLFTIGGAMAVGIGLDYLPRAALPLAGSFVALGFAVGVLTKMRSVRGRLQADRRWRDMPERGELEKIERTITPRWERFATKLRDESGFRTDVRVGDIHEADRLVSLEVARLTHPDTWRPDPKPNEVRYGWRYSDGRVVEQQAELEDATPEIASSERTEPELDEDGEDELEEPAKRSDGRARR